MLIVNRSTKKIHYEDEAGERCNVDDITYFNKYKTSVQDLKRLLENGYTVCKYCENAKLYQRL